MRETSTMGVLAYKAANLDRRRCLLRKHHPRGLSRASGPGLWPRGLTTASGKWALSGHRGQRLDPLGKPGELRVDNPEIGEVPHGAGEIVAVGAATAGGGRQDPRVVVQVPP